jgi:phenylalanyl-tRNA synthetase beta chain
MKASYAFIRELLPALTASPRELSDAFTFAGLEVEGLSEFGAASVECVVVAVVSRRPHPTKDKLALVTVDLGEGKTQEVVCGAPNVPEPGGLVVLAPLGAHLPAAAGGKGMTMARRDVAGVPSEGMLCSESELGLSDSGEGILVLPPNLADPGTRLSDAIPSSHDHVFEVNVTPNRPDALGHVGLAREAAALYDLPFAMPSLAAVLAETTGASGGVIGDVVRIQVEDAAGCPHYGAAAITGVSVHASPLNVRYRLAALGMRSISNVVDVTNLAMLGYGHPMHAFDLDRLGGMIVVRRAKAGEKLATLDGMERTLDVGDLVIADAEKPIALAGVMGGATTEVHAGTTRVLFECAYFDPRSVRRSARRHGMHTEASHRFERGVDPGDVEEVLAHALATTRALAGGKALDGMLHVRADTPRPQPIKLQRVKMDRLLGVSHDWQAALSLLERLGCTVHGTATGDEAELRPPTHRPDLLRSVDMIEEVARVRGIDSIPAELPPIRASRDVGGREELEREVREAAVSLGLSEAVTFAFVSPEDLANAKAPPAFVGLKNPLAVTQSVMRTRLLPGLLQAVGRARRHGVKDARLFTIGRTYVAPDAAARAKEPVDPAGAWPVDERTSVAAVFVGERPSWLQKPESLDVWDVKGTALELVARATRGVWTATAERLDATADGAAHLHPRGAARLLARGRQLGTFGPLHPDVLEAFDLTAPVFVLELDLEALRAPLEAADRVVYKPIPRFPASARDVAVVVKDDVLAGAVVEEARRAAGDLGQEVALFDRFTGGSIPAGHTSLALRVVYRAAARTLTDAEVDARHTEVTQALQRAFAGQLR